MHEMALMLHRQTDRQTDLRPYQIININNDEKGVLIFRDALFLLNNSPKSPLKLSGDYGGLRR